MPLLQPTAAIYHHPLNDSTESIKSEAWSGSPDFSTAKVGDGMIGSQGLAFTGADNEFESDGAAGDKDVVALTATKFVVVWRDQIFDGKAKVGTITGSTIAFGTEATFETNNATGVSIAALSDTKVIIGYRDTTDFIGKLRVGTITGTSISFGTASSPDGGVDSQMHKVAGLTATKFAVIYQDPTFNDGACRIGTISGTSIASFGSIVDFNGGLTQWLGMTALSATTIVVGYKEVGARGEAKIGTISGESVSFGAASVYAPNTAAPILNRPARLSDTKFVMMYTNVGLMKAKVGTVSGSTITFGAEADLSATTTGIGDLTGIDATTVLAIYRDSTDSDHGTARLGTVTGTSIAFSAESEFESSGGATSMAANGVTGGAQGIVVWNDQTDSNNGTAKVADIATAGSLTGTGASYTSVIGSTKLAYTGWMKNPSA